MSWVGLGKQGKETKGKEKWVADAEANGRSAPEPAAHYKFASFARFRCARQKMSQSFRLPFHLFLTL